MHLFTSVTVRWIHGAVISIEELSKFSKISWLETSREKAYRKFVKVLQNQLISNVSWKAYMWLAMKFQDIISTKRGITSYFSDLRLVQFICKWFRSNLLLFEWFTFELPHICLILRLNHLIFKRFSSNSLHI